MHLANLFLPLDFDRGARDFGCGRCHAQPSHCHEGLLNEVAGGKNRDCCLVAVLRDDCESCSARQKIEDAVSLIALAKESLLRLHFK
jgi:hypothetical protein